MSWERWFTAKSILGALLAAAPEEREDLVRRRCGPDRELEDEVRRMLTCHSGFLSEPAIAAVVRPPLPAPEEVLGGRYRLGARIGLGAFGRVHRGTDLRTGREVAVKLVSLVPGRSTPAAVRRELAALRRARLPGVAELLDDGLEGDVAWLVMALVEGRHFPSASDPRPWDDLAPLADSLLTALDRLHWAGVLHRDLKPANVLVTGEREVTLVDLGLALDTAGGERAEQQVLAGTPTHMAPELLTGAPPTVQTDLYAAGVLLWEALSGRPLHDAKTLSGLRFRRLTEPAPPPEADAPAHVVTALAALLEMDPSDRPRTVRAVIDALLPHRTRTPFRRIGTPSALDALLAAVRERRAVDVAGEPGSGRSRLLDDAETELAAEGRRVLRTVPAEVPFGSLAPLRMAGASPDATLEEIGAGHIGRLRTLLGDGAALFADDAGGLDPYTVAVLESVRGSGAVVRVFPWRPDSEIQLAPLGEDDLREIFHGPDRLLHLREDAARALLARTGGAPGRVFAVLAQWERNGVAREEAGRYEVTRAALDGLLRPAAELPPAPASAARDLGSVERDTLAVLEIAGAALEAETVARALELGRFEVEAAFSTLAAGGLVRGDERGRCQARGRYGMADELAPARLNAARSVLAEAAPPDSEWRVDLLVAAGRLPEAASAACAAARTLLRTGEPGRAHSLLSEALCMIRGEGALDIRVEEAALELLLDATLALGTTAAADSLVYHLERSASRTRLIEDLELLARAALATVRGDAKRALSLTELSTPLVHDDLDEKKHVIRVTVARLCPPDREREVLAEALAWARPRSSREIIAHVSEWLGWYRYRRLDFARAASLHARAARLWKNQRSRISASLNASSAAMEAGRYEEAERLALNAERIASRMRQPLAEARAGYLLRCIAYRRGVVEAVDTEFLDAVVVLGSRSLVAVCHMTEAAIAWRARRLLEAATLAGTSARVATECGMAPVALLMRALVAATGEPPADPGAELDALTACALPRIRAQAAALFARAGLPVPAEERGKNRKYTGTVTETARHLRCEVLSILECEKGLEEER